MRISLSSVSSVGRGKGLGETLATSAEILKRTTMRLLEFKVGQGHETVKVEQGHDVTCFSCHSGNYRYQNSFSFKIT